MKPKILSKKIEYESDWLKLESVRLKLPTGKIVKQEKLTISDFVAIVPVDDYKNIYLVKEWRVAWGKEILQIPAGGCKGRTEKEILNQARNELREEIGFDAKKWQKLLTAPLSARIRVRGHLYLARDLFRSKKKGPEEEIIQVVKIPFKKAYKLLLSGKVLTTSYTLLVMTLAKEKLNL